MAFVIKTKKGLEFQQTETNDIGPGEYLPQTKIKHLKVSKTPFLFNVPKGVIKDNKVPGPGSYYQDDILLNYLRNIYNEKKSCKNDRDQVLVTKDNDSINLKHNVEKLGFCQKEKRFKHLKQDNPGPGCYFPSMTSNKLYQKEKKKIISERKRMKELITLRQETCITSIPVNNQVYGFDITSNGTLIRKPNPEMYRTFSGEKGDSVGPGSYELDYPNRCKSVVEWSKGKSNRLIYDDKKDNIQSSINQSKLIDIHGFSLRTTGYSENKQGTDKTKISFMKCKIKRKTLANELNQKKMLNLKLIIQENSPGPGYYYDMDKMSSFKTQKYPEYKQFFGSRIERFQRQKDLFCTSPASYYIFDKQLMTRKEYKDRLMTNIAAFSTKIDRFKKLKLKENKPGPGQYNQQDQFNTTIEDKNSKFGTTEKRFSQTTRHMKEQYCTPGPGSYYNLFNATGSSSFKWKRILLNIGKAKEMMRDNSNIMIKSKSTWNTLQGNAPPVGQYNPELLYTIDYKINKNKRLNLSDDIAFNSGISKLQKPNEKQKDIGPGYYYHDKKTEIKQIAPPFYQSEIKNMNDIKKMKNEGSCDYKCDSYYNWNKKTFNLNYV